MKTKVACHECGTLVQIESAFHRRHRGFRCEKCQESYRSVGLLGFWFVLFLAAVSLLAHQHEESSRNELRDRIGVSAFHSTDAGNFEYSVSLAIAKGLPTDGYSTSWQEQIPSKIISVLRDCASITHDVAFDGEEALEFPGSIIENTNQSIVVYLRSPDGEQQFKLKCKSDDLAYILGSAGGLPPTTPSPKENQENVQSSLMTDDFEKATTSSIDR